MHWLYHGAVVANQYADRLLVLESMKPTCVQHYRLNTGLLQLARCTEPRNQARWRGSGTHDVQAGQPGRTDLFCAARNATPPLIARLSITIASDDHVLQQTGEASLLPVRHSLILLRHSPHDQTPLSAETRPLNRKVGELSLAGRGATGLDCCRLSVLVNATAATDSREAAVCAAMPAFQGNCAHDHDCDAQDCSSAWSLYKHIEIQRVSE
jgi:hypothetical protein